MPFTATLRNISDVPIRAVVHGHKWVSAVLWDQAVRRVVGGKLGFITAVGTAVELPPGGDVTMHSRIAAVALDTRLPPRAERPLASGAYQLQALTLCRLEVPEPVTDGHVLSPRYPISISA